MERPLKIAIVGDAIGIVWFLVSFLFLREEITGWNCAVGAVVVFLSGVVAVGAKSRWRWALLFSSTFIAGVMGLVAYVYMIEW
jgi:uncharacterized membrane protein (UPF0136 family)